MSLSWKRSLCESLLPLKTLAETQTGCRNWSQPKISGKGPSGRAGHRVCKYGHNLVVWGGADIERIFSDLFVLDTESLCWHQLNNCPFPEMMPTPRVGHSATIIGSEIFIFGGSGGSRLVFNDMYILDADALMQTLSESKPGQTGSLKVRCSSDSFLRATSGK